MKGRGLEQVWREKGKWARDHPAHLTIHGAEILSSPVPRALSSLCSYRAAVWSQGSMKYVCVAAMLLLLSCGQSETQDRTNKGEKWRKWGEKSSGSMSYTLQGGLEQKCFCTPFLQSLCWQEKGKGTGLRDCAFALLLSPPRVFPCVIPSSAGSQVGLKLPFKNIPPPSSSPTEKNPSPCFKFCWVLNVSDILIRVFMYLISRQIEIGTWVRL